MNLYPRTSTITPTQRGDITSGDGADARKNIAAAGVVGYNAHHEGVRHVARDAAVAAAIARGPPAGTGEPLACLD